MPPLIIGVRSSEQTSGYNFILRGHPQVTESAKILTRTCPLSEEHLLLQSPAHPLEETWKALLIQEVPTVWAEDHPPGLAKRVTCHRTGYLWGCAHLNQAVPNSSEATYCIMCINWL